MDEPPDRPDFIRETVRLLADRLQEERTRLLRRVERASDAELASGTDQEWGIGQVGAHLLVVERGVLGIALRLAKGESPGATGQPRPAAAEVSRGGIVALAERTRRAAEAFRSEFPAQPDDQATARHPFLRGDELLRLAAHPAEPLLRPPHRPRAGCAKRTLIHRPPARLASRTIADGGGVHGHGDPERRRLGGAFLRGTPIPAAA